MIQIISFALEIFFKYSLLYFFLFTSGRSFVLLIELIYFKNKKTPDYLLKIKSGFLFPIIGIIVVGNLLILLNYFLPLRSFIVYLILFLFNLGNFIDIKKINLSSYLNLNSFICYVFFPAILLISTSDINFHYDAGYYHLNHQNWLRESNMVIGMVNIFWAFGMSSIYEYISAILWIGNSFIFLHFLSLIFIHFFYLFIFYNIINSQNQRLRNASMFLLLFSIFDNFGLGGGRNGFLYIQGIGKQDIAVAVLFIFVSLITVSYLIENDINGRDFISLSIITFFIYQLKISNVFIYIIFLILVITLINQKVYKFNTILYYLLPNFLFAIIWFVKSYMTTGCIIFPVNFLCINNFAWYLPDSTKDYETISTDASFSYIEYLLSSNLNFIDWFNDFFNSLIYSGFSEYYRSFYINFLVSLALIFVVKRFITESKSLTLITNFYITIFLFLNLSYLILFGPIPRYLTGLFCVAIGVFGFYSGELKYKINKNTLILTIMLSIFLVPRANSYIGFLESAEIALFDPTEITELYNEVEIFTNWVRPDKGDRCYVNLKCTMHTEEIF